MPNLAVFHPQIVHFVIVLAFVGVGLRIVSFTPWFKFANVAARTLILMSAVAAYLAVDSGTDAHGPVERIPGARQAVQVHEDVGHDARGWLLGLAALELLGWALETRKPKAARAVLAGSAVVGLVSLVVVYRAGQLGGELVYAYAGGVGTRSGDTTDVNNLVTAALYNGALNDRKAGRHADAARLIDELARRRPADPQVKTLVMESWILDRNQPRMALDSLAAMHPAANDRRAMFNMANLKVEAYLALGQKDSARAVLQKLATDNPQLAQRLQPRIDSLR